jgi:hypothetical protein
MYICIYISDMLKNNIHNLYMKHYYVKYEQSGGGGGKDDIVKFINTSNFKNIIEDLPKYFMNNKYCDKILGQGYIGKVKVSTLGKTYPVNIKNKLVNIPIVIKESHIDNDIHFDVIDDTLFIYSDRNIVCEAIILEYINKLLHKSPHLPKLIGYDKCDNEKKSSLDKIITERQGLDNDITIPITGFFEKPLWRFISDFNPNDVKFTSNIATLGDLFNFINLTRNNDTVKLPNNIECNIIDLCNYLCISYLMTYKLLYENNIQMSDMHSYNIFIHWLNDNSYMDEKYIGNIKNIYYKLGNKYLKIKTFGFILKIGDVGTFIIHPKNNIYIAGQVMTDIYKSHNIIRKKFLIDDYTDMFLNIQYNLPHVLYSETIACDILSSYPFNEMKMHLSDKQINDIESPENILTKYFDKYLVGKVKNKNNVLVL